MSTEFTKPEPLHVLMHEYNCPMCGTRWRQQVFNNKEMCISCQYMPVNFLGSMEREIAGLSVMHRKIKLPGES